MRLAASVIVGLVCASALAAEPVQRTLSFEERAKAQTAIERVYYGHQVGATKPFDQAVPKAVIEAKVRKYLEQSAALNVFWKTAVTDQSLQRELERMAAGTRMPERLQELYAALGNDPFLVKECLARATLVDRLTRNFYAFDSTMHVKERAQAEELHRRLVTGELSPSADHPNRTVSTLTVGTGSAEPPAPTSQFQQHLTLDEFRKRRAELPARSSEVSEVKELQDAFIFKVIVSETTTELRTAGYLIPKVAWDAWWVEARRGVRSETVTAVASADVVAGSPSAGALGVGREVPAGGGSVACARYDVWDNGRLSDTPDPRTENTAVWTGSVMVVWGGWSGISSMATGGRYDPTTDTWAPTATAGAPSARAEHAAVWTGSEMIVWGGVAFDFAAHTSTFLNDGGRYNPSTDTWSAMSSVGAPPGRQVPTAVWTGNDVVFWGGWTSNGYLFDTGGRYNPTTDSWRPTSTTNAPSARRFHSSVWTGTTMLVWGGDVLGGTLLTGGKYDPVADLWTPISTVGAPSDRAAHTAVWTGNVMVIWGGYTGSNNPINTGGRYNSTTDSWTPVAAAGAPTSRAEHTAVWTGTRMLVWGGYDDSYGRLASGGSYDPLANFWTPTSTDGAPLPRNGHSALWTGGLMLVWGGGHNTGGRYDPSSDSWTPTSTTGAPEPRARHTAIWTGNVMVVWGGLASSSAYVNSGGRYDPTTDAWTPTATIGAPTGRFGHVAVWTGSSMLVWGGVFYDGVEHYLSDDGRYDPQADSWTPMTPTDAPTGRFGHSGVWTGSKLIIWGGRYGEWPYVVLNTGGSYDPEFDVWTPTSAIAAPRARFDHSAVWTGTRMVVWGGEDDNFGKLNTGGRYDPTTNAWTPTSTTGAPLGRTDHSVVWTGNRMVVWGGVRGTNNEVYLASGGRYEPTADQWTPTSGVDAPSARRFHSAIWTGHHVVVWGGEFFNGSAVFNYDTGGRYDPAADTWTPTSTTNAAIKRVAHTAVWTGHDMVVWGGAITGGGELNTGGRYGLDDADRCDDANPCTDDACDSDTGCVFTANSHACDNGNACTVNRCQGGICVAGDPVICDDGNPCTTDSCNPAIGCVFENNTNPCEDGYECTINDTCTGGSCVGARADGMHCDDGDPCTIEDTCFGYYCYGGPPRNCEDGNACTDDYCSWETGGCVNINNDANTCGDGDLCTHSDACHAGVCTSEPVICTTGCPPGFSPSGGFCQRTYRIGLDLLDNQDTYCDGTGMNRYTCYGNEYGFHWADLGVSLADVARVDVRFVSGFFCQSLPVSHTVRLNGVIIGGLFRPDSAYSCTCFNDLELQPVTLLDVNPASYSLAGLNSISIARGQDCQGLSRTATLGDSFAEIIVRYVPFSACQVVGVCDPGSGTCPVTNAADGTACADNSACTSGDTCQGGTCVGGVGTDCDDTNPCTDDSCDPVTGACVIANNANECDDGNVCTANDRCGGGACNPGGPRDCSDSNPCTEDSCDSATGECTHASLSCSDGNACNGTESCRPEAGCVMGIPLICGDNNPCTDDACDPAIGCVYTNNAHECDDADACTVDDACVGGVCRGTGVICDDHNPCTTDTCNSREGCAFTSNSNPCDDGNGCTVNDRCGPPANSTYFSEGFDGVTAPDLPSGWTSTVVGIGSAWITRVAGSESAPNSAFGIDLDHVADGMLDSPAIAIASATARLTFRNRWSFDDATECFDAAALEIKIGTGSFADILAAGGSFLSGGYTGTVSPFYNNPLASRAAWCTTSPGYPDYVSTTVKLPPTAAGQTIRLRWRLGSDSSAAAIGQDIDSIVVSDSTNSCQGGPAADCDDNNPCTDDSCDPATGCVHTNNSNACSDGSACTTGDTCSGGACHGTTLNCDDSNPCTTDTCDPATGCVHTNNTDPCDDGNACTTADACSGGTCHGGPAENCDDGYPCTIDECDPVYGCSSSPAPSSTQCSDGNVCNGVEFCDGYYGECHSFNPLNCDDGNPCTTDSCDPATGCVHTNNTNACNDGNACTTNDACGGGRCFGTPLVCNDGNACTNDTCDFATGCVFTNNTNACDDGNACTQSDVCANGACVGLNPVVCAPADQCRTGGSCNPATGVCSGGAKPDGTACNDGDLCTIGETCQAGTCTPATSGLNEANPRTNGYYKRLCQGPHSGDQLTNADALCVASVASNFAGIATVADICAELQPSQPNNDSCDHAEDDLMVLALNICRARVCTAQSIDSQCGENGSVGQSLAESNAILSSPSGSNDTCAHAKCLDEEINTGRALELNSLTLRREAGGIRLEWRPPYLEDGTGHPSKYHVWRRVRGSLAKFTKIGITIDPGFLDAGSGSGAFEYEVTAVMN